jgi:MFS family permease
MAGEANAAGRAAARQQIVFINAAHLLTHYSLLILPTAVLVMARPGGAFGDDYGPIVALATGMFVLYGVGSLPQGWLAARIGRKALMAAFFIGTGLSLIAAGFVSSPLLLALTLSAAGLFAAIYHPVGTAMLVEAASEAPGRAIGVNGVFGNFGVALAPVVTAFLAQQIGWRAAFVAPGIICVALGLAWLRVPAYDHHAHHGTKPFPQIPAYLVRRAVIVLLLIAVVSGLVFNAFTIIIPKLIQERLASDPRLLPVVGTLAFLVTICGAATQFTVGRLIDRKTLKRVFLPMAITLPPAMGLLAFADGWPVLVLAGICAAVRFFVGFLGSAAAAPLVAFLHERTGDLFAVTLTLAAFTLITVGCALFFPDRREELKPELWSAAAPVAAE